MKYYVFIARDEEEFSRYPGLRGGFHEKTPGFLKSVRYIEEDGYCVLILPHEAKNVDADGNVDVRRMCTNVAAAINGIGHKYNDADKICIIVHLGGEGSEGIDKWEQDLNVKLKDIKDEGTIDIEKWSIKLLSSTRKDIIDITAGAITIPERADLERLAGAKGMIDIKVFVTSLKQHRTISKIPLYVEETFVKSEEESELPQNESFIPLILCRNKESLRGSGVICPREYIIDLSVFEKAAYEEFRRGVSRVSKQDLNTMCDKWMQSIALEYNFDEGGKSLVESLKTVIEALNSRIATKKREEKREEDQNFYAALENNLRDIANGNIKQYFQNLDGYEAALKIVEWIESKAISEEIWEGVKTKFGKVQFKNLMLDVVHKIYDSLNEDKKDKDAYVELMIDAVDDDLVDSAVRYVLMSKVVDGVNSQETKKQFCDCIIDEVYKEIRRKLFESYSRSVFLLGICKHVGDVANRGVSIEECIKPFPKLSDDNQKFLREIFTRGIEFCNKEILQRLEFLEPVSKDEYKAWFLPLFRKYCFQDEHAHGGSHLIDLPRVGDFGGLFDGIEDDKKRRNEKIQALIKCERVKDDGFVSFIERETKGEVPKEAYWFDARFMDKPSSIYDPYNKYKNLLKCLFKDELDDLKLMYQMIHCAKINAADKGRGAWIGFKATMAVLLSELVNKKEIGLPLSYLSPTKKINVLVVDDKGSSTVEELERVDAFNNIFSFYQLQIKISDALCEGDTIINYAIDKIRKEVESGRTYEIVLLDLSLGEDPGYDLMGYHIVYRIKQFMPQSKIMIYSKLDDMGHIVRALGQGASWYLRKYNKHKLPRHVFSMLRAMEWKKEWRTVWSNRLCDFTFDNPEENRDFIRSFDGKRKYLTYRCLERYPGVMISIKPMKGGLSASATFKAVKGLIADGDPIQTPVIVKIDTAHATRLEYERYFRFIRPYIANESGRVENPEIVLDDENAAIVYTYAGKQDPYHGLDTMKSMFVRDIKSRSSCDYQKYEKTFDSIFNEILPQIHQVSPQVEFSPLEAGSADIAARDLPKVPQTNFSDYPNHVFGEFCKLQSLEDNAKDEELFNKGFLANYLCRMPIVRKLDGLNNKDSFTKQTSEYTIVKKSINGESAASSGKPHYYYEYHDKDRSGECTITSYDLSDKCSVIMKGKAVDHIVKYRPYTYPCMALWVAKEAEPELQLEEGLKDKIAAAYNEKNVTRAVNKFSEAVYDFLGENPSAGRPTSMYFQQVCCRKVVGDKFCEIFQSIGDKERSAFQSVIKMKEYVDRLLKDKKLRKKLLDCPIGIVHGDLNCANIMLETRKNVSKIVEFSDAVPNIRDVWFIDFARTRRDFISHDFNVMFTSVLGMLFDKDVWDGKLLSCNDMTYRTSNTGWQTAILRECATNRDQINAVYRDFIIAAVTGDLDAVPDFIEKDKRMSFIFRVLRRIRKAALRAGISEECYLLTTALSCTVASRIAIVHEKNAPASAAMIAAAVICLAEIKA